MPRDKPSMTARKVALDFLYGVEDPAVARLAPDGSITATRDLLLSVGLLKPWMISLMRSSWYRKFGHAAEKATLPGHMLHLVLRKRFLDDEVRAVIAAGATQVLAVGGGYDTLCLRLAAEYPGVTFLEVDHPPTHKIKTRAVEAIGAKRPNLRFEGVDLGERSLRDVLARSSVWHCDASSATVAEGVLMYLSEDDVVSFFDAVRSCSARGSRVLATYVLEGALSDDSLGWLAGLIKVILRLAGEPFLWGVDETGIEPFLAAHGFWADDLARFDLRRRYLEPAGEGQRELGQLEKVVAAESLS